MPTLLFHHPPKKKRWRLTIAQESFTIGRSREADVCIPLPGVSKKHVAVERKGGRFLFRDLGSRNGLSLNGFPVREGVLNDGDELDVGGVLVTFYREEPPEVVADFDVAPSQAESAGLQDSAAQDSLEVGGEPPPGAGPPSAEAGPPKLPLLSDDEIYDPELEALAAELETPEGGEVAETILIPRREPGRLTEGPADGDLASPMGGGHASPELRHMAGARARIPRRHVVMEPRMRIPAPFLILLVALAVGAGLLLGHLATKLEPQGAPSAGGDGPREGGGSKEAPREGAGPGLDPLLTPVSLNDAEAARRLIVRLHLDFLGRPPLRGEMGNLLSRRLDDIWLRVFSRALPKGGASTEEAAAAFPRFLGREAAPGEVSKLLELAKQDPRYFLFHLTTSRAYASAKNRKPRSERQLALSLHADLLDRVPSEEDLESTLRSLRDPATGLEPVVDLLLEHSTVGPEGEVTAGWCREQFVRCILRYPSAEEEELAVAAGAGPSGWRGVLRELVLREEYRTY